MTAHAKLSPSAAHRWVRCPASVAREAARPVEDDASEYSLSGSITHAYCAMALEYRYTGAQVMSHVGEDWQLPEYPQRTLEHDRAERVAEYVDYVNAIIDAHTEEGVDVKMLVEVRVDASPLLGVANVWGTTDCALIAGNILHIIDYKDGRGVAVSPVENEQLVIYAAGVMSQLMRGFDSPVEYVVLHIVQPQNGGTSSETYSAADILHLLVDISAAAQKVSAGGDLVATPGDKQCRWCKVKASCPELQAYALASAQALFNDGVIASDNARAYNDEGADYLADMLTKAPIIRLALDAVAAEAERRAMHGDTIPGFKLVRGGRSSREWSAPEETLVPALVLTLGCDSDSLYHPRELKSPAQVEKGLKKADKEALQGFITRRDSDKLTLVPLDDKRQPVSPADVFDGVATAASFL